MPRLFTKLILLALLSGSLAPQVRAGAYLLPEGYGQSRRFDRTGQAVPSPAYRKVTASGYFEYGLKPWLTIIAAPTLARENGVAANTVTGSDSSAIGARLRLWDTPDRVLSVQVLVQPPIVPGDRAAQLAAGGARNFAVDARLMYAQSFSILGRPAFVDVAPGVRAHSDPFPSEARLDVTLGIRPVPRLLFLLQSFLSLAPPSGPVLRTEYDKLQASLVFDLSPRWSVQLGAFRTIAGRNEVRETGPFGSVWVRF